MPSFWICCIAFGWRLGLLETLAAEVDHVRDQAVDGGEALVEPLLPLARLAVHLRQHPWGRSLKDRELADLRLDLRQELHRRSAGTDHGDTLAGQVDVVIPACGVEGVALEILDARDVRHRDVVHRSGAGDHVLGDDLALVGGNRPLLGLVVPVGHLGERVELNVGDDPEALGDVVEILLDLRLLGERAVPVGVARVAEGIDDRGGVGAAVRVGVLAPGAAELLGLLDQDEVLDSGLLQADGGADAAVAAADDEDLGVLRCTQVLSPERSHLKNDMSFRFLEGIRSGLLSQGRIRY